MGLFCLSHIISFFDVFLGECSALFKQTSLLDANCGSSPTLKLGPQCHLEQATRDSLRMVDPLFDAHKSIAASLPADLGQRLANGPVAM